VHEVQKTKYWIACLSVRQYHRKRVSERVLQLLQNLDTSFDKCRGQDYDNGANMKGQSSGVQSKYLKIKYFFFFFVNCVYHSFWYWTLVQLVSVFGFFQWPFQASACALAHSHTHYILCVMLHNSVQLIFLYLRF